MYDLPVGMELPRALDEVDAEFMTKLLQARGVIAATNSVVSQDESDVGMTAGYFSAIKRIKCHFAEATDAQNSYVVKAFRNFRTNFAGFEQYAHLSALPDNSGEMAPWTELPDHLL